MCRRSPLGVSKRGRHANVEWWHACPSDRIRTQPYAGQPFSDDDAAIAASLADVSIPALLCSLVHMTGDPAWVRGPHQPAYATSVDFQGDVGGRLCRGAAVGAPGHRGLP